MLASKKIKLLLILTLFAGLLFLGCSGPETDSGDGTDPDNPPAPVTASAVGVTAGTTTLLLNASTTVTATAYGPSGQPVAGAAVIFTVSNPTLASITATGTTDGNGQATSTLTARTIPGNVTVSASVGDVTSSQNPQITITSSNPPAIINLTATPATIQVNQSATIRAEVLDQASNPVTDGTAVTFSVDNSSLGSMSSNSATTTAGIATRTFQALGSPGTATITATAGSQQAQVSLTIMQSPPQALAFISAEPQLIALADTAGVTTSLVRFQVLGSGGLPLEGVTVQLALEGPNGGEFLNSTNISSDAQGFASVILNSGRVAGPVTITGTITTLAGPFVTRSSVISIGGGVPSAKRFGVAATVLNLPGLAYANEQTEITAYLADRFGNYNILKGTTVSFATEVGLALLSSQVTLNDEGFATVTARTQPPTTGYAPEDVAPLAWEITLQNNVTTRYGVTFPGHPRNGWCSILIHTMGEEHFDDLNGNGQYDAGEFDAALYDTAADPFCDYNDSGIRETGGSDPPEVYVDSNSNGSWDAGNGVWDANKRIFSNFKILLTGQPYVFMETAASSDPTLDFTLRCGESKPITFLVSDENLNTLIKDTAITVTYSGDGAKLSGNSSWKLADSGAGIGRQIEFTALLTDSDLTNNTQMPGTLTVKVNWHGVDYYWNFLGRINLP